MRKDYEKLFSLLERPSPSAGLLNRIMERIHYEQHRKTLRWRLGFFALMLTGSAVAAWPAFRATQLALVESGFVQFFSLIFSDFGIVLSYWDSFGLLLLESLPVVSLVVLLGTIFVFLESLKYVVRDIKTLLLKTN